MYITTILLESISDRQGAYHNSKTKTIRRTKYGM